MHVHDVVWLNVDLYNFKEVRPIHRTGQYCLGRLVIGRGCFPDPSSTSVLCTIAGNHVAPLRMQDKGMNKTNQFPYQSSVKAGMPGPAPRKTF
jgi:hypothetical protein